MKILLDEQLPVKLKYRFMPELEISTVKNEQWLGIKNGSLLLLAANSGFDIFITNDKNLEYQQKLIRFKILFININQPTNRYKDVLPSILSIKEWILKNKNVLDELIGTKNYRVYPNDMI